MISAYRDKLVGSMTVGVVALEEDDPCDATERALLGRPPEMKKEDKLVCERKTSRR